MKPICSILSLWAFTFIVHAENPVLTVKSVVFNGSLQVVHDEDASPYGSPHWSNTGNSKPAAFVRDSQIVVTVTFTVTPANANGNVLIKGSGSIPFTEVERGGVVSGEFQQTFTSSVNLPNRVDYLFPLAINWQYRKNELGSQYVSAGISGTPVYVLLSPPGGGDLYRTVLNLACGNPGATTAAQAVANTWSLMAGRSVTRGDGLPLHYYHPSLTASQNPDTAPGLLALRSGQCAAWGELMGRALSANGIVDFFGVTIWPGTYIWPGDQVFLVRNWTEGTGSLGYPYRWLVRSFASNTEFEMVGNPNGNNYLEMSSGTGIPGQNVATPGEKLFGYHYIIKWGSTYYDPSYGTTYVDAGDMEGQAVDAFGSMGTAGANFYQYEVRRWEG